MMSPRKTRSSNQEKDVFAVKERIKDLKVILKDCQNEPNIMMKGATTKRSKDIGRKSLTTTKKHKPLIKNQENFYHKTGTNVNIRNKKKIIKSEEKTTKTHTKESPVLIKQESASPVVQHTNLHNGTKTTKRKMKEDQSKAVAKKSKPSTKENGNIKQQNVKPATKKAKSLTRNYDETEQSSSEELSVEIASKVKQENTDVGPNKVIQFTGVVPVDDECTSCVKDYHVHVCGTDVYNAMLNQTNVGRNNNKYYLIQLLKHNSKPSYCTWFRWGRVGKIAGTNLQHFPLDKAIAVFEKKFLDKTKNYWEMRDCFEKHDGKYDLLEMDYGNDKEEKPKTLSDSKPVVESKLPKALQDILALFFDVNEFEESVKEMQYNVKKAPLGKLTDQQIKAGYASLKKIESSLKKKSHKVLVEACNEFYTRIPHDFGMRRPPIIHNQEEMKEKLDLLQALGDIQIAINIISETDACQNKENPLDSRYRSLQCDLSPLGRDDDSFKVIKSYVCNTHAVTHRNYALSVENVFAIAKQDAESNFTKTLGNRRLLWHGSRLSNWCGILQQGLRIAPPEAPSTGYMFGKGIYFADMVSKSANYCFASQRQPFGFLVLCEVALGKHVDKLAADSDADALPKGVDSVRGVGKTQPDPKGEVTLDDGVVVPCGKPVKAADGENSALLYNEFVVYDANQVRPRFLVQLKFDFVQGW